MTTDSFEICTYDEVKNYVDNPPMFGAKIVSNDTLKPGEYLKFTRADGHFESTYIVNPYSEFVWSYPELLLGMQVSIKRHMHRTFGAWVRGTPCLRNYQFTHRFREIMPSIAQEIFVNIP